MVWNTSVFEHPVTVSEFLRTARALCAEGADCLLSTPRSGWFGGVCLVGIDPVAELVVGPDTEHSRVHAFALEGEGPCLGWLGYEYGLAQRGVPSRKAAPAVQGVLRRYRSVLVHSRSPDRLEWFGVRPEVLLRSGVDYGQKDHGGTFTLCGELAFSLDRAQYEAGVRRTLERIRSGWTYQLNLSMAFSRPARADRAGLAAYLFDFFQTHPAAFYGLFHGRAAEADRPAIPTVLSTSPERFLRVDGGHVLSEPIKGTLELPQQATEHKRHPCSDVRPAASEKPHRPQPAPRMSQDAPGYGSTPPQTGEQDGGPGEQATTGHGSMGSTVGADAETSGSGTRQQPEHASPYGQAGTAQPGAPLTTAEAGDAPLGGCALQPDRAAKSVPRRDGHNTAAHQDCARNRQDAPHGGQADCNETMLAEQLRSSPKEDAELSMIVDLIRNDISACCQPGTVRVCHHKSVFRVDRLLQMYSQVHGRLEEQSDCMELLLRAFPGGSVTGCPKVSSLQIIDELEPHTRGAYCGSLLAVLSARDMDSSIAIRTAVFEPRQTSSASTAEPSAAQSPQARNAQDVAAAAHGPEGVQEKTFVENVSMEKLTDKDCLEFFRGPCPACVERADKSAAVQAGTFRFHAGSGIVVDSDPASEYQETVAKAAKFLERSER